MLEEFASLSYWFSWAYCYYSLL